MRIDNSLTHSECTPGVSSLEERDHQADLGKRFAPMLLCIIMLVQPGSVFAYIDPNAGGVLFQLLAPLFAACVAGWVFMRRTISQYLRNAWRRLTGKSNQ